MGYVIWVLAALLLLVVLLAVAVLWTGWTFYLHYFDQKLEIELRGPILRRHIFFRDFRAKQVAREKEKKKEKNKNKKRPLADRIEAEKKRIYDAEHGGYQAGGLRAIYAEYREVLHEVFGDLRYRIEIPEVRIRLDFGTGDPASTGMIYGGIWSVVGVAYPLCSRYFHMAYPKLDITPDFYQPRFDLEVKSIIKVKPAHIIKAVLKQLWKLAKSPA